MKVPLLDLQAQYASIRGDVLAAVTRVCDTQQFILGPEVEQLERELAFAIGVRVAVAVSSGTDALLAAMMAPGIGPGAGLLPQVTLPVEPDGRRHIYHQYVVRVPRRDAVRRHLASRDSGTDVSYPVPFHRQECFAGLGHDTCSFPNADAATASILALPIDPELTAEQQHVVDTIAEALS